jgi:hypothetical protein
MTKQDKLKEKEKADLGTVFRDAQDSYGLIKKAAAKGTTGKKQDRAELLGAIAKTTKGVVELAIDQRKKYVAKKQNKAVAERGDKHAIYEADQRASKVLTFQARLQSRGDKQGVVIDTGAPCTVIDKCLLEAVDSESCIYPLERPLELWVGGVSMKSTSFVMLTLFIAGETADIQLPCVAYVVNRLHTPQMRISMDVLVDYQIDLLLSEKLMRINACEGEFVRLR